MGLCYSLSFVWYFQQLRAVWQTIVNFANISYQRSTTSPPSCICDKQTPFCTYSEHQAEYAETTNIKLPLGSVKKHVFSNLKQLCMRCNWNVRHRVVDSPFRYLCFMSDVTNVRRTQDECVTNASRTRDERETNALRT